jgi:thiol:disulfide interchange protein
MRRFSLFLIIFLLTGNLLGCKICSGPIKEGTKKAQPVAPAKEEQEKLSKINWLFSFEEALEDAETNKRPLMVDFGAEWCGWCKKMDEITFADKDVIRLSKKFTSLKLDWEKDKEIFEMYGIEGFPTFIFMDSKGKEIHRVRGFKNPQLFIEEMKRALKIFQE